MAYDAVWAQRVLKEFRMFNTRVEQINGCIGQELNAWYSIIPGADDLNLVLTKWIRSPGKQKAWRMYKSLCKKTPLDRVLLRKVMFLFYESMTEIDVSKIQRQFCWD
jgi:hypothetical protein